MSGIEPKKTAFLHDAEVRELGVVIDQHGERTFRVLLRCDPEWGYEAWNDREIRVDFCDPIVILGELFGHMANAETLDAWRDLTSAKMESHIKTLTDAGIRDPKHLIQLVFHSGSIIEVACEEIHVHV